jgi:hypothetical protein
MLKFMVSISLFEAELGEDESLLASVVAFGDYWTYVGKWKQNVDEVFSFWF